MITTASSPGITKVFDNAAVRAGRGAVACLCGAAITAALLVAAPHLAPAPAHAACDNYQFKGGSLRIDLDESASLIIPATGKTMGSGRTVVQHPGGGAYGNATGGITGRKIDFTIANWDAGAWAGRQTWFTGTINDDGSANGFYYVNTDGPGGWHTTDTLSCVPTPGPAVPAPAPMPKLPPPPSPPTNAVTVSWGDFRPGVGLPVQVKNSSTLLGHCTYDATAPNSLLPPYHRDFVLAPSPVPARWDIPGLPTGTQWHVVVSCSGDFDGRRVEFGHVETNKTF